MKLIQQINEQFKIVDMDIFDSDAEVMVFSTNPGGYPVLDTLDIQVYLKAGFRKMMDTRKEFLFVKNKENGPRYGDYIISEAFDLGKTGNFKHLIQIITPKSGSYNNYFGEDDKLADCYKTCVRLAAKRLKCKSIVFPLLGSSDVLDFGEEKALKIAKKAIDEVTSEIKGISVTLALKKKRDISDELKDGFDDYNTLDSCCAAEKIKKLSIDGVLTEEEENHYFRKYESKFEFITFNYHQKRIVTEMNEDAAIREEVRREREEFYNKNKGKYEADMIDDEFAKQKIRDRINEWIKEEPSEYERQLLSGKRSCKMLARIVGSSEDAVEDHWGYKGSKAKRQAVLAYAVAMKLTRNERVKLMLCYDLDSKYPKGKKETTIEEYLNGFVDGYFPEFDVINENLVERYGNSMCISLQKKKDIINEKEMDK